MKTRRLATAVLAVCSCQLALVHSIAEDDTLTQQPSFMAPVRSYQARVESAAPVWDDDHKVFVSGHTPSSTTTTLSFQERYRNTLDSVTTSSVEGALMYLQRDCIDVGADPIAQAQCRRKNDVSVVTFLEVTIVQPFNALSYYQNNRYVYPEFCPFVTMQNGQCVAIDDDIVADMDGVEQAQQNDNDDGDDDDAVVVHPPDCQLYHGLYGNMSSWNIGPCVGAHAYPTDMVAPYPDTVWFSYPGSCVMNSWTQGKSDECRSRYKGGLCPFGTEPDGVTCTFKYRILGYVSIDELVGITTGETSETSETVDNAVTVGDPDHTFDDDDDGSGSTTSAMRDRRRLADKYDNYKAFCEAKGVELHAGNDDTWFGLKNVTAIPFWQNPSSREANVRRTNQMIALYNRNVGGGGVSFTNIGGRMKPLPTNLTALTATNPPCHANAKMCYESRFGCQRHSYAQVCTVCREQGVNCVTKVPSVPFAKLAAAPSAKNVMAAMTKSSSSGASTTVAVSAYSAVQVTVMLAMGLMAV